MCLDSEYFEELNRKRLETLNSENDKINKYIHTWLFGNTVDTILSYTSDPTAIKKAEEVMESKGLSQEYKQIIDNWEPPVASPTPLDKAFAIGKLIRMLQQ